MLDSGTVFPNALLRRHADGQINRDVLPFGAKWGQYLQTKAASDPKQNTWLSIVNAPTGSRPDPEGYTGRCMTTASCVNKIAEGGGGGGRDSDNLGIYVDLHELNLMLSFLLSYVWVSAKPSTQGEDFNACDPDRCLVETMWWGRKGLNSTSPSVKGKETGSTWHQSRPESDGVPRGPFCRCEVNDGGEPQRMHTDLPVLSKGQASVPPGQRADSATVGGFIIFTFDKGTTLRLVPNGQRFMNANGQIFAGSVAEAKFVQGHLGPWSALYVPADEPHGGDGWLFNTFACALMGELWARQDLKDFAAIRSNQCGCRRGANDTTGVVEFECDGTCTELVVVVLGMRDQTRGHFYFTNKSAKVKLANLVYTRGVDSFADEELGGLVAKAIQTWRETGVVPWE